MTRASLISALSILLAVAASISAQSPTPTPETDDVVKITTNLAQLVNDFGYFRLPANMEPGDHTLQIIVSERLPNGKTRSATQLVDFEVIE